MSLSSRAIVTALALVTVLSSATGQAPRTAPAGTKVIVHDRAAISRIVAGGGRLIADYGSFVVVESTQPRRALDLDQKVTVREDFDRIFLNSGAIDTRAAETQAARRPITAFQGKALRLVQFAGPMTNEWRKLLVETGLEIVTYVPENAYLVYGTAGEHARMQSHPGLAQVVQWDGEFTATMKIHPDAALTNRAGQAVVPKTDLFTFQLVADPAANEATLRLIGSLQRAQPVQDVRVLHYRNVTVRLDPALVAGIAARPDVVSVHPFLEPRLTDERQAMILAGVLSGGNPAGGYLGQLATWGFTQSQFTASGFVVDVTDSGIDNGTTSPNHFGLFVGGTLPGTSRVVYQRLEGTPNAGSTLTGAAGHGTLDAHILGGFNDRPNTPHLDGGGYHFGTGVAPFVRMGASVIFDSGSAGFTFPNYTDLIARAYRDGARISSNSWGINAQGAYDTAAQAYDALVRDGQLAGSAVATTGNQQMVIVFAAGNNGPGANTTRSPGTSKNVITVGASENVRALGGPDGCGTADSEADNANDIAPFSARGPCDDGRFKPDLMAPGTHITGGVWQAPNPSSTGTADPGFTGSNVCGVVGSKFFPSGQEFYTVSTGTSHACPAVSGAAALVRQDFLNKGRFAPSPAMTKAALMATTGYLSGTGGNDTLPSNSQGLGRLDLSRAFATEQVFLRDQLPFDKFTATGQTRSFTLVVPDSTKPVRLALTWTDAPGSTMSNAYNNNLDLTVVINGQTYRGNVFSGGSSVTGGTADVRNNAEFVFLPAGITSPVVVTVTATSINSDGVPGDADPLDQDFALYAYNAAGALCVPAGATLFSESFSPPNGLPDPGEAISMDFTFRNIGPDDSGLTATLQATGGITSPSGAQFLPIPAGETRTRNFTFVPAATVSGVLVATFTLVDNGTPVGTASFILAAGRPPTPLPTGYTLASESFTPANNLPDLGEVVTVNLTVQNTGTVTFGNLVGTLPGTVPISSPGAAQSFGALAPGASATRTFSFTVSGTPNTAYSLPLQLQDGATSYGSIQFPGFRVARAAALVLDAAVLVAESAAPANGWPDQGEVVTLRATFRNPGESPLPATSVQLLATGNVLLPSPATAQDLGVLAAGATAVRDFTFTGGAACGGTVTATIAPLQGSTPLPNLTTSWNLGTTTQTFTNASALTIPGVGTGSPSGSPASVYPSTINVAGLGGNIQKVVLVLTQLSHTYLQDVDLMLVAPAGQVILPLSDVGPGSSLQNLNLEIDDAAASSLPFTSFASGSYRPTNFEADTFPAPAPTTTPGSAMSVFNGSSPNGTWSLYVSDDAAGDTGSLGSWGLRITTGGTCAAVATDIAVGLSQLPSVVTTGTVGGLFSIANQGPHPATGVTLTVPLPPSTSQVAATPSVGGVAYHNTSTNVITVTFASLAPGESVGAFVQFDVPDGSYSLTGTMTQLQTDSNPANNVASFSFVVLKDLDGDGLPDAYETANGLNPNDPNDAHLDADGDGRTNLEEYRAGTDPRNAASSLAIVSVLRSGATGADVTFRSSAGKSYRLVRRAALNSGTWTQVGGTIPGTGSNVTVTDPDATGFTEQFYRVELVLP